MDIQIKAIHFEMGDKLEAFVNKKIDRLARRFENITSIEANLRLIKPETSLNKEAGIQVEVPGSPDLYASKTADTFEEAVDLALEALERQLEKLKGRS